MLFGNSSLTLRNILRRIQSFETTFKPFETLKDTFLFYQTWSEADGATTSSAGFPGMNLEEDKDLLSRFLETGYGFHSARDGSKFGFIARQRFNMTSE